jgi:death on curing protein
MIVWMDKPLVLAIHDRQVAEHGGSTGLRDGGLLESALARPQQLYACGDPAPDLADLAASLAFGLARNHPFVDGNKRTAAVCCETFIELNGGQIDADDPDLFAQYLAVAEGKLPERDFAAWLRPRLKLPSRGGVHEPRRAYAGRKRAAVTAKAKPKRSIRRKA